MLTAFIAAILPVMIIALLGAVLSARTEYLDDPNLPKLIVNVGMPCLLFHSPYIKTDDANTYTF